MTGADVYLKAENLQKTGSFKVRGAFNKMTHIRGNVIAASMGNHAQAVAFAAGRLGINAKIVMPVGKTKVVFIVETRSKEHLDEILLDLTAKGFKVRKRTNG
jgi:threonine dehydratase